MATPLPLSVYPDDYAISDRGGIPENLHRVHIAVTDATGNLLLAAGNPHRLTLARSAIKPVQTLALLEIPGFDERYGFDESELALMCASHNSEERHLALAKRMLSKVIERNNDKPGGAGTGGVSEADLRCGGHPAGCPVVNREWIRNGFTPTAIYNNCSGKHVGMLAGAALLDDNGELTREEYHSPDHPLQVRIRRTFEDITGLGSQEIGWAIDGCNLPAPALPLNNIAHLFATLAGATPSPSSSSSENDDAASSRTGLLSRIYNAMTSYPELIAGTGRFCTELMQAYNGALVGKVGADAVYAVGVRESEATRRLGANGSLGIAVKVDDGNLDVLYAVVPELLERLKIGDPETLQKLDAFHRLRRLNTADVVVGGISFPFTLRQV